MKKIDLERVVFKQADEISKLRERMEIIERRQTIMIWHGGSGGIFNMGTWAEEVQVRDVLKKLLEQHGLEIILEGKQIELVVCDDEWKEAGNEC